MKGDKLVFTKSNSVYRDKLGPRPTADEVISGEEVKTVFSAGNSVEDNGNRFTGHATDATSYKQVRRSLVEVMRLEGVPSATHNVYAYRFEGQDGAIHEGSNDDGEHGAGRQLLRTLVDNEIKNRASCRIEMVQWKQTGTSSFHPHMRCWTQCCEKLADKG